MTGTVSRVYSNFRGVDFRGEEINLVRSPDSLNMWKDYKNTESIRTRPALEGLLGNSAFGQNVHSLSFYKGKLMVHVNKYIVCFNVEDKYNISMEVICEYANDEPSQTFVYNGVWYFKQRGCFLQYDGALLKGVEGYVPTTSIARKPSGGGTIHQDVNMLTTRRRNTFLADGESTVFHLDSKNISGTIIVKVNDKVVTNYTVNNADGTVTFKEAPAKPLTDGQDNVSVEFNAGSDQSHKIKGCTMLQVFDNRVFFSGNSEYPNMIWHSSLDDPTYISDLDYYQEGRDEAPVRGMVAGNNALWVFREPSDESTTVFYHVPTIDAEYGKIYPSTHSSISTGCVGKATNFNDDIVFFSERGMEGISGDVTTEQVVAHRSSLVDRKLTAEAKYRSMVLAEWEGYLLVFIGNKVYLADSRGIFTNENHMEYEWFYWDFGWNNGNLIDVTCAVVHDGVLYIGTASGNVFTIEAENTDYEAVTSYWVTPKDKFKHPHKLKTTNKKSCTVEAEGEEISVYAKTNKDSGFELLDTFDNVTDAFNLRIKVKKFKDIQLKFYSQKRFALETATLECFIGGYLKNL